MEHFETQLIDLRPTLYQFTRKFTSDKDESLDLIQDTILKALTYRHKFTSNINLKGWLYTIMRNTYINNYRKAIKVRFSKGKQVDLELKNLEDTYTDNVPEGSLQMQEVWKKVNTIDEDLNKPFKMYTSGYKYQEIADHLKLPLGTVKNRIFQARQELQKLLPGYC